MALNKTTLSQQIYKILRNDILQQNVPCGSKLTLKMLQERFEVSSTPIREALTRLAQDQLVTYYSNVGVSVVSLDEEDIREVFQLMGDFDALAIIYAANHPDQDKLIAELEDNLSASDKAELSSAEWIALSDDFHLIFYRYCNNSRLVTSARRLRSQMSILAYQYEKDSSIDAAIMQDHREISQLFCQGKSAEAAEAMRRHLMKSMEYALNNSK